MKVPKSVPRPDIKLRRIRRRRRRRGIVARRDVAARGNDRGDDKQGNKQQATRIDHDKLRLRGSSLIALGARSHVHSVGNDRTQWANFRAESLFRALHGP